jgi:hypothetical protein
MSDRPYTRLSAEEILGQLAQALPAQRNQIAELLLYHTHERPLDRAEQQRLFIGMVHRVDLAPNNMLNARAAAMHKSLELADAEAVLALLPRLETALADSRGLPWRGSIRHNRIHVGFSLSYVLLLGCLFADQDRFDRAAEQVLDFAQTLPTQELGRGFFRTSANLTKCLGLIALRQARAGQLEQVARIVPTIRAALLLAVEVRELREAIFPIKRNLPRTRLDRSGPLSEVAHSNEFKENMRAHRILACVMQMAEPDTDPGKRSALQADALELCVSNAYPGERAAQIARFDALFPPHTR